MRSENAGASRSWFGHLHCSTSCSRYQQWRQGFAAFSAEKFLFIFPQLYPLKCCKKMNGALQWWILLVFVYLPLQTQLKRRRNVVIILLQSIRIQEKSSLGTKLSTRKNNNPLMAWQNIVERLIKGHCRVVLLTSRSSSARIVWGIKSKWETLRR